MRVLCSAIARKITQFSSSLTRKPGTPSPIGRCLVIMVASAKSKGEAEKKLLICARWKFKLIVKLKISRICEEKRIKRAYFQTSAFNELHIQISYCNISEKVFTAIWYSYLSAGLNPAVQKASELDGFHQSELHYDVRAAAPVYAT